MIYTRNKDTVKSKFGKIENKNNSNNIIEELKNRLENRKYSNNNIKQN